MLDEVVDREREEKRKFKIQDFIPFCIGWFIRANRLTKNGVEFIDGFSDFDFYPNRNPNYKLMYTFYHLLPSFATGGLIASYIGDLIK